MTLLAPVKPLPFMTTTVPPALLADVVPKLVMAGALGAEAVK
jgi:hypothetical protein